MLLGILLHLCCFKKKNLSPLIWLGRAAAATPFGGLTHGDLLRVNIGLFIGFRLLFSRDAVSETYFCVHVCNKLHCCSLCLKPPVVFRDNRAWGRFKWSRIFSIFGPLHSCRAVSRVSPVFSKVNSRYVSFRAAFLAKHFPVFTDLKIALIPPLSCDGHCPWV